MPEPKSKPRSSDHPSVLKYATTLDSVRTETLRQTKTISVAAIRRKASAVKRKRTIPPIEPEPPVDAEGTDEVRELPSGAVAVDHSLAG